jgi:hypothetical protein
VYQLTVYLGRDGKCANPSMTTTYAAVTGLTSITENVGHRLYLDSPSPALFDYLLTGIDLLDRIENSA